MNGIDAINTTSYLRGVDTEIRTEPRTDRNTGQETETKAKTSDEEAREKRLLEDTAHPDKDAVLVGRNADGDTTKASRIGLENLKDGIVIRKDTSEQIALKKEEEKAPEKVGSMMGFTDTQVEELYYQGRISRNDYETELKRRERIDSAAGLKEEEKEEDKKNPVIESSKEEAKKVSDEKALQAKESAAPPKDSIGSKEDEDKKTAVSDENRKQLISDEIEKDNAFAKEMGQINQRQQDFSLRADAITEGIANDRADTVIDVLDAAEKIANGQEVRQN